MDHHEFSPSRLEQCRICPGSYLMQKGIPETETEYAREGKLLHNAVATGNLHGLNDEQKRSVEKCNDFINTLWSPGTDMYAEKRVCVVDSQEVVTFGTADLILRTEDVLTVVDWKFGYTPVKEVNENIQLASYAVGAMQLFNAASCDCWVFQPRIGHKSHHVFTSERAIISNIRNIIRRAQSDTMTLKATEESCRYCRARLNCPAFRVKFQRLTASRGDYDLTDTNTLVRLYDASRGLNAFIKEIEAAVKKAIERDGQCGKYRFDITEGSRQIKDLNALYAKLKDYVTQKEFNDICTVTLGKLESLMSRKLIAEAKARGETMSNTAAVKLFYDMVSELVTRGSGSKGIVEAVQ